MVTNGFFIISAVVWIMMIMFAAFVVPILGLPVIVAGAFWLSYLEGEVKKQREQKF